MIKRILCLLGYHEWHYQYGNVRKCWHCGFKQGVYEDKENQ